MEDLSNLRERRLVFLVVDFRVPIVMVAESGPTEAIHPLGVIATTIEPARTERKEDDSMPVREDLAILTLPVLFLPSLQCCSCLAG